MMSSADDPPARLPDAFVGHHPVARLARIAHLRLLSLGLLVALIALGLVWELWLAPLPGGTGALAWKVLPLTVALAGLLKHRLYTFRWLSLLIWLYVTEGLVRVTSDAGVSQVLAGIELVLSVLLFAAAALYIRLRLRVLPPKVDADKAPR